MPKPIVYEGKELNAQEFAAKLRELKEQKNYSQIVELSYQTQRNRFETQDTDMSYVEVLDNFFKEITPTIPDDQLTPEELEKKHQLELEHEEATGNKFNYKEIDRAYYEDILGILDAFNKKYHDTIMDAGKKRDEYQQQIRDGKVPGTDLFKDDPNYVKRIAHDYVMLDDGVASDAMVECFRQFTNQLYGKTINIRYSGEFIKDAQDNYVADAAKENNTSEAYIRDYIDSYEAREFKMSTNAGFQYKKGPFSPNESRFEKFPNHIKVVQDCKSEAELDALEEKLRKQIDAYQNYERQIRSAAKISQTLYNEFESIDWPNKETISYVDLKFGFEHFTHMGKDYRPADPQILSKESRKTEQDMAVPLKDAPPSIVENAVANAERSLESFFDKVSERLQDLEDKGQTDTKDYQDTKKMVSVLQSFNAVKITAQTLATDYQNEFHTMSTSKAKEAEASLEFIKKKRQLMKLTVLPEANDDDFTKSIDQALDTLSDSIVDCNLRRESTGNRYENLSRSLMEHKRIYKKVIAAEQAGNDKLAEKYAAELEKSTASVKKQLNSCKSYDKSYANEDGHTMGKANRRTLLTSLSEKITSKTNEVKERVTGYSYDKYIRLHTGKNAGKTVGERKQNLLKAISATYLMQNGHKFNINEIHKFAKTYDAKYCVTDNYAYLRERGGHDILMNATKDAASVIQEGNRLRKDMYGIKNDQYNKYIADMKTLADSMRPDKGRSTEYQNLVKAIKAAAALDKKTAGMSPEEKQEAFINANFDVINSVKKYVKGKEKIRLQDKGNDAFDNSMDALAIVSKYTKQENLVANHAIVKVYSDILDKSNRTYLTPKKLEKNFGAKRAADAYKRRQEMENKKNKKTATNKTETKKTETNKNEVKKTL